MTRPLIAVLRGVTPGAAAPTAFGEVEFGSFKSAGACGFSAGSTHCAPGLAGSAVGHRAPHAVIDRETLQ